MTKKDLQELTRKAIARRIAEKKDAEQLQRVCKDFDERLRQAASEGKWEITLEPCEMLYQNVINLIFEKYEGLVTGMSKSGPFSFDWSEEKEIDPRLAKHEIF